MKLNFSLMLATVFCECIFSVFQVGFLPYWSLKESYFLSVLIIFLIDMYCKYFLQPGLGDGLVGGYH